MLPLALSGGAMMTNSAYDKTRRALFRAASRTIGAVLRFRTVLLRPADRSAALLTFFRADEIHQTTPKTAFDRYPRIFAELQRVAEGARAPRILSFGCASGEEVLTLRKYFPDAEICGAEINRTLLRTCRRLAVDPRITFIESTAKGVAAHGPFDIIVCMAVLQRTPTRVRDLNILNLSSTYPFERFNRQLVAFDASLKNGGLLLLGHAHYSFADASVADRYDIASTMRMRQEVLFDRSGRRTLNAPDVPLIFRKRHEITSQ